MSLSRKKVPLGTILQQAGLVSADNVKEALLQQREDSQNRRIGDILASQGYINPQTADFFVESLPVLIEEAQRKSIKPIGQYLKQAKLLNEEQIQAILDQQQKSKLRFGEQAVKNGFIGQKTVDFFLRYLVPESTVQSTEVVKQSKLSTVESNQQIQDSFYKIKLKLLNLEDREDYYKIVLDRVLLWTEGQSFLTQKLFNLITENQHRVVAGKEAEQVDYFIETKILKNWRNQATGNHFQIIESRLLNNQECQPIKLLRLYQQILMRKVAIGNSQEQRELIKMGLVIKQQDYLVVANRIYEAAFDLSWIEEKLGEINNYNRLENAIVPVRTTGISSSQEKKQKSSSLKNLLLLLTLTALLLLFFNNLAKKIKVRTAFKKGNQLLQQKSFNEAIAEYNTLLHIDSNYFQAWTNRGYALAGLQKYEEMRESCSTATIINPKAVYAWNCRGEALHNLKREQEAIASFDQALALDKTDPIFLINKSESLKSLGEDEQSLATISQAIEVLEQMEAMKGKDKMSSEFAVALTFRGNNYRKQEKYEPAIFNYNRALEYFPDYFPARIGKGIILKRVERYVEAQEEFESILENEDLSAARQAQTWFYLGKTLCQSGQNTESIAAFEKAIEQNPDYQAAKQAKKNCE